LASLYRDSLPSAGIFNTDMLSRGYLSIFEHRIADIFLEL